MILVCKYCHKEYKTSHRSSHYCSHSCRNKDVCTGTTLSQKHIESIRRGTKGKINVGEMNPQYGKIGKDSITYGTTRTIEVKQRLSSMRIGKYGLDKNPNWKGGKSFEPYPLTWTKELKTRIRKRDHFTCQVCGKNGYSVHHIDYNKENCSEENLITLCKSCHARTHHNRESWIRYFNKQKQVA